MFNYNPTMKDFRDAFTVAYGEAESKTVVKEMFHSFSKETIESMYKAALTKTREDMVKAGIEA